MAREDKQKNSLPIGIEINRDNRATDGATVVLSGVDIEHTCEAAWGSVGLIANVTTTADASVYKVGAKSAKHVVATAFTTGHIAWALPADAATDMADYTHVTFYILSTKVLTAGQLKIGFDNAADFSGAEGATHRSLDIPAVPAINTWYRVRLLLSNNADIADITSMDSFGITVVTDLSTTGNETIYIDDVRFCTYTHTGSSQIDIPAISSLAGDVFQVPSEWARPAQFVSTNILPVDAQVTFYGDPDGSDTYPEMDQAYLELGQYLDDHPRACSQIQVELQTDMGAGDEFRLGVVA